MLSLLAYAIVLLSQVDLLEQDVMEVISLIRSMKNSFAPINQIPLEILSLIPEYWDHDTMDEDLITLTHVCRGWRELFIACSRLWSCLDCTNVDKTLTYICRSKSSCMDISLFKTRDKSSIKNALLLAVAQIGRFRSLSIVGSGDFLQNLTKHLTHPAPSLKKLEINLTCHPKPILDSMLFNAVFTHVFRWPSNGNILGKPSPSLTNTLEDCPRVRDQFTTSLSPSRAPQ